MLLVVVRVRVMKTKIDSTRKQNAPRTNHPNGIIMKTTRLGRGDAAASVTWPSTDVDVDQKSLRAFVVRSSSSLRCLTLRKLHRYVFLRLRRVNHIPARAVCSRPVRTETRRETYSDAPVPKRAARNITERVSDLKYTARKHRTISRVNNK